MSEREKIIGSRLRAFRESLQIPRSKFSVSVGYASERLAAYEAGRARLPYDVFKAISDRYRICPRWLAEGIGASQATTSFDDSKFIGEIRRNSLFTEVYDKYLANQVRQRPASAEPRIEDYIERLQKLIEALLR
jgi:transcriptional regulator with XRE-family HTH domain